MKRDPALIPLSHHHQHGLAATVLIRRSLDSADVTAEKLAELKSMVASMWTTELEGHFAVEEDSVFPAARIAIGDGVLVDRLISEHRRLEKLVPRVATASEAELAAALTEFADLLTAHIRAEERELFEQMQAALPAGALHSLGEQIAAHVSRSCPVTAGLPWQGE